MKTIKLFLIAATLICATAISAEEAQPAQKHEFKVAIGDSVMIKRECQKYCTGERPSVWVWDKVHTVRQLGTKRFSDGVLLMNIYSWMCEDCLINVSGQSKEAAEQAAAEQAAEKAAYEQALKEGASPQEAAERAAAERAAAEQAAAEQAAAEQADAEQAAAEKAAAEQAAAEQAAAEQAAAEQAAAEQAAKEQEAAIASGDSLASKQNFKHNYDRFTIGVRGGASSLMHHADLGKWTCGFDALLDLQYAHYWAKDGRPVDLGLIVGVGIGYHQSGLKTAVDDAFPSKDNFINYTVTADQVKENDGQIQLEVPLMFSLIADNGIFFNIGPKFMIPVFTPYNQTITNPHINAYFPSTGVTVSDEVITGLVADNQLKTNATNNGVQFNINVMLTAEIGYEWLLKNGNSLGLGAYANYSVFNTFKNNNTANTSLIDLQDPSETGTTAAVDILSATRTYADKLGYFDAGIKLAYHFNFPKKQYKQYKDSKLF